MPIEEHDNSIPEPEPEKRWCFWIPSAGSSFVEGRGYIPAIVTEDEPGYQLMTGRNGDEEPWYWGPTEEDAEKAAAAQNAKRGISEEDALRIVASSMGASVREGSL